MFAIFYDRHSAPATMAKSLNEHLRSGFLGNFYLNILLKINNKKETHAKHHMHASCLNSYRLALSFFSV